jgi:shikimate dehydrogenase
MIPSSDTDGGAVAPACFIIGHPVAHSRSPLIHGHWLAHHGLAGSYRRVDVAPVDLNVFVAGLRDDEGGRTFIGGNVTVPHKQAILPLLDVLTPDAKAMGAVNTVYRDGDRLCGDNTDAAGFIAHLDLAVPDWRQTVGTVLVLGAGGAALAVTHALKARAVTRILVANRDHDRARGLAARLGPIATGVDWSARSAAVAEADLIVNTTSLGMTGQPPLDLDLVALRPGAIVYDIVYVPVETPLLVAARAAGARTVDGLGMLLHQAVPGFARWFGLQPQVTPDLRHVLEVDIVRGSQTESGTGSEMLSRERPVG